MNTSLVSRLSRSENREAADMASSDTSTTPVLQSNRPEDIMKWLDDLTTRATRQLARRTSRRSVLGRIGAALSGVALLPLLPVSRALAAENPTEVGDAQSCDYWRYCALGGALCSCCGGTMNSCPPGAEPSPVTWVGTCNNPADGKDYLISYNDCCGKSICARQVSQPIVHSYCCTKRQAHR